MTTMIHNPNSQVAVVLNHLQTGAEINPLEALSLYGIYRLGAVIFVLKKDGYNIMTRIEHFTKPSGKRGKYAVYKLIKEERKDA